MCHKGVYPTMKVYGGIYRTRQSPPHLFADEKPPSKWDVSLINYEPRGKSRVREGIAQKGRATENAQRQTRREPRAHEDSERQKSDRPDREGRAHAKESISISSGESGLPEGGGSRALPRPDAASVPAKQKGRQRKRGGGSETLAPCLDWERSETGGRLALVGASDQFTRPPPLTRPCARPRCPA